MCQATEVLRAAAALDQTIEVPVGIDPSRRAPRKARPGSNRAIVLGTAGGGNPKNTRRGYANAVVVGDVAYLVDAGEGVNQQAWRSGISMHPERRPKGGSTVKAICFTHLHSDHMIDYMNLVLGFWPTKPIDVHGPGPGSWPIQAFPEGRVVDWIYPDRPNPGLREITESLFRAYAYNINVRMADEGRHDVTKLIRVHEIGHATPQWTPDIALGAQAAGASGWSMETAAPDMDPIEIMPTDANGVRITAILVQHAPVFPAMAYRFDTPTGSVVFSGDTGPCDNVVKLAKGADVLVHDTIDVPFLAERIKNLPNRDAVVSHLRESHTSAEDCGRIAQRAGVKTLVLSHLVPGDDEFTSAEWEARAKPYFDGEVVCGVDLDQFELGGAG